MDVGCVPWMFWMLQNPPLGLRVKQSENVGQPRKNIDARQAGYD